MKTFEKFISPLPANAFLKDYWQHTPLFLDREGALENVLSVEEIDEFFNSSSLTYPSVRVIGNGKAIELEKYSYTGKGAFNYLNKDLVFNLYSQGNTIVVQGASFLFKGLGKFVHALEEETGMQVHTNIYITPSNSKGFDPHFDTHEVFVYQVNGSKNWNIYDMPVKAPVGSWHLTEEQRKAYIDAEANHKLVLKSGSVLYIPRGVVHDAFTNDEPSIHITFGFHPLLKLDILKQLLAKAKANSFFRESFFPGFDKTNQQQMEDMVNEVSHILKHIIDELPLTLDDSKKHTSNESSFGGIYTIDQQKTVADFINLDFSVEGKAEDEEDNIVLEEISAMISGTPYGDLATLKKNLKTLIQRERVKVSKRDLIKSSQ